jgi:hypothetical protein
MSQETSNKRKRTRKKNRKSRKGPDKNDNKSRSSRRSSRSNRSDNSSSIPLVANRSLNVSPVNYPLNQEESQREDVIAFLGDLKDEFLNSLYITLGGQPNQIPSRERLIQLLYKAINTSARIDEALEKFHQKDQEALRIILQCGGVVHKKGIIEELRTQLGGTEAEWEKNLTFLGSKGLLMQTEMREDVCFFVIPKYIQTALVRAMKNLLLVPVVSAEGIQEPKNDGIYPPFLTSLSALMIYFNQNPVSLTQQRDVFKQDREKLDTFFQNIWDEQGTVFPLQLNFLLDHNFIENLGDGLQLSYSLAQEWFDHPLEVQNTLFMHYCDDIQDKASWLLTVLHNAGDWVSEQILLNLYRRWVLGARWCRILQSDDWNQNPNINQSFSFMDLLEADLIEVTHFGKGNLYRLSQRSRFLFGKGYADVSKFHLTQTFNLIIDFDCLPKILFKIGEIAEFVQCAHHNTFKITQESIQRAIERGWKRDDILEFLKSNSINGLPLNVEQTIREWCTHQGDIEFHAITLITVVPNQISRFESLRELHPYLLHRFSPGLYAVDISRIERLTSLLKERGFNPTEFIHRQPSANVQEKLQMRNWMKTVHLEWMEQRETSSHISKNIANLDILGRPTKQKKRRKKKAQSLSAKDKLHICNVAIQKNAEERVVALQIVYRNKLNQDKNFLLHPEWCSQNAQGEDVLVAKKDGEDKLLSYRLSRIQKIDTVNV